MHDGAELFAPGAADLHDPLRLHDHLLHLLLHRHRGQPGGHGGEHEEVGGFVPGIRPGKHTADYIDRILLRITLPGAIFLALIAVLPDMLMRYGNVPFYFGGTSLLIVVGVALDTLQQIESHLLMRHYDGFMKKGRIRARR